MSEMIIDLSNYKDRVGSRVAEGRYRVVVEDAEPSTSSAGNAMVVLYLRIAGGEFDGQTIVDRLTMTEKALFRVVGFMSAIGLPTPKKKLKVNVMKFVGRTLEIDVEDGEPYQGRVKSEVRGYMRAAKSEAPEVDELGAPEEDTQEEATEPVEAAPSATRPSEIPAAQDAPAMAAPEAAAAAEDGEVDLDSLEL